MTNLDIDNALAQDSHWQYNKNFIDWVVDVAKSAIAGGGLADDMIASLKQQSTDSIMGLKSGAKKHKHRAAHMIGALHTIRGLS